jgi:hypothetical protein
MVILSVVRHSVPTIVRPRDADLKAHPPNCSGIVWGSFVVGEPPWRQDGSVERLIRSRDAEGHSPQIRRESAVKTEYLIDPTYAVARMRHDDLLAEAARARLVAEARAGAARPTTVRRAGLVRAVAVVVAAVVLAGATLPYLAGATAGQVPRSPFVRYVDPPTPAAAAEDGSAAAGTPPAATRRSATSTVRAVVARALAWFAASITRIVLDAIGWPAKL